MSSTHLLVIDDDTKLCRLLKDYLEPLGYTVDAVHNGAQGLERAAQLQYAAVILDVMLPGMNGIEVLRELRKKSDVPVLMLTALGDEPDRIAGLEVGADDYLPKTFSTRELLARLRAVLRRSMITARRREESAPEKISLNGLVIDIAAREAALDNAAMVLTTTEFDILLSLVKSAGRVKTREQLLLDAADRDFEAFDRSIDVHVSSLRKKLNDDAKSPRFIETVRGIGYRMRKPGMDPGE